MKFLLLTLSVLAGIWAKSQEITNIQKANAIMCLAQGKLGDFAHLGVNEEYKKPVINLRMSMSRIYCSDEIRLDCKMIDHLEAFLLDWLDRRVRKKYGLMYLLEAPDDSKFHDSWYLAAPNRKYPLPSWSDRVQAYLDVLPYVSDYSLIVNPDCQEHCITLKGWRLFPIQKPNASYIDLVASVFGVNFCDSSSQAGLYVIEKRFTDTVSHYYPPGTDYKSMLREILTQYH